MSKPLDDRRQAHLIRINDAFAALRSNPEAWAEEEEERVAWEATLSDGLEEDIAESSYFVNSHSPEETHYAP